MAENKMEMETVCRKMKPFPATAPQVKSHVRNWRSKGHLAPLMRPTKFPEIPVSLERNTEVFRQDRKSTRLNSSHHRDLHSFPTRRSSDLVRNWRSKGHLAPLMRPTKFPEIPVSLERNTEVFRHPLL